jgi:hypothetical protein
MPTLGEIADRAQNVLADAAAGTWSQATVQEWIIDAIKEYTGSFPRRLEDTITTTAGTSYYDLPADFQDMLLVEFPTGDDPPTHLQRMTRRNSAFWLNTGYYDVAHTRDALVDAQLWLSGTVVADTITFTYLGAHDTGLASDDSITIPIEHEHLLILWVVWRAHQEREADELQNPDTTIRMLHQMKLATQAAEAAYYTAMREAKEERSSGGFTAPWRMDRHDRIY